jgi:hypothetical protein
MAEIVECLPSKHKVMNSNPSTTTFVYIASFSGVTFFFHESYQYTFLEPGFLLVLHEWLHTGLKFDKLQITH